MNPSDRPDNRQTSGAVPRLGQELTAVSRRFGVRLEQADRDLAISLLLAELASIATPEDLTFIGGTALARTHLPDSRLSEDIDLLTDRDRGDIAATVEAAADRLRRRYGRPTWRPALPMRARTMQRCCDLGAC